MRRRSEKPGPCTNPCAIAVGGLLEVLARPWTMHILYVLSTNGPTRFGALRRQVEGISSRVLTQRLRGLEEKGVVYREYEPTIPPAVTYGITNRMKDIKQEFFYDRVPVGGKIRVFGSVTKLDPNPDKKLTKREATDAMASYTPEQIFAEKANTYRRWFGGDWALIEKGGQANAGEWNVSKAARLKALVDTGHRMGYLVSFYCLNGYTEAENQGWDKDYNFGSREAVLPRWKAAIEAKADFIATDQYEDVSKVISASK